GKGEKTNPRGANGQPLRCDHCNSEKHLWRKCDAPGADDYRRKRATSGGKGYVTTEGNMSTGGAQPASSFTSALQHWQQLTGQTAESTATRHFFAMPSNMESQVDVSEDDEKEYEDSYYPDVEEEGSRLCESHARPDLQEGVRRDCASSASWDMLSTPSEFVDIGNETIQMIEQAKARIIDDPDTEATLGEPRSNDEQIDSGTKPAGLKWFVGPAFERYDETRQVFLEATRIDGKECLLIDPGAYDNLVGDRWVMRMGALAKRACLEPTQRLMDQSIGVEGVGTNAQIAKEEATRPGAANDERGKVHQISYNAPVVPDSDIPALWGKRSLKHNRAVVDMINNKLYLCGPGRAQFTPPPGTPTFNLEDSRSGHLLLPISHFFGNGKDKKARAKQEPATWHASAPAIVKPMIKDKANEDEADAPTHEPSPATPSAPAQDPDIIVIDEDNSHPIRAKLLSPANITYTRLSLLHTSTMEHILRLLERGKCRGVWMRLHSLIPDLRCVLVVDSQATSEAWQEDDILRATATTLPGYRMTDHRWCSYLTSGKDMAPTTSQRFFSNLDLLPDSCSCGRKISDHRRSTGLEHVQLECQFMTVFWQNRLRDKLFDAVRGEVRDDKDTDRDARYPQTGPDEPVDSHMVVTKSKTVSFYPTDSAKAYKEKLKSRKAEGHEPKKKVKKILDPEVMDDCGEDLGELNYLRNEEEMELYQYLKEERPFVLVMAPQCIGTAGWCTVNESIGSEVHRRNAEVSFRLGQICAKAAHIQLGGGRHYVNELPRGSRIYRTPEWMGLARKNLTWVQCNMCMLGLVNSKKEPLNKPEEVWASHEVLIYRLRSKECDRQRRHGECSGRDTKPSQVWTWQFARILADGISELIWLHELDLRKLIYPTVAAYLRMNGEGYRQHELRALVIEYIPEQEKKRRTQHHILKPDPQVLLLPQLWKAMMTCNLILKLDVVDTCTVCREWQRRGEKSVTSLTFTTTFNEGIQFDLLFLDDGIVVHLIDMCIRWAQGIRVSKEELLDESLLAMNTLLSVHGATPYAALYGRVPIILLELGGGGSEFDDESGGAVSRHVHRVRELALANIAQGNAQERLKMAARTQTRPAAQLGDLRAGDSVDIFRDPPNKDVTGWRGPCKVVAMDRADEGIIDVRWQGRTLPCRPADVRKAVTWLTLMAAPGRGDTNPYQLLVYYVENMAAGTTLLLGYEIGEDGHWRSCDRLTLTYHTLEVLTRCPTFQHHAVKYGLAIRMMWKNDLIDGIAGGYLLENTEKEMQVLEVEFESEISRLVIMTTDARDLPKSEIFSLFANDEGHRVILSVNSTGKTKMVIEREADELNKDDLIKHRVEVEKAMPKELGNWIELGALKQRSRLGCTNLMDSRWVIRWKKQPDGKLAVEARLCIKGFQDLQQDRLDTFSATASRQSQRIVNFIAASRPKWALWSCDVGSAFLKGLTFQDVADMTGEPLRTVQLDLPKDTVKIARQFEPLSNYDVSRHCLEMVRPGFGLKDAPRLWNLRLKQVMTKLQLLPLVTDSQFYCKWAGSRCEPVPRELVPMNADKDKARGTDVSFTDPEIAIEDLQMVCSTRVDDLKGASTEPIADAFMDALESLREQMLQSILDTYSDTLMNLAGNMFDT
ncbi:unnamed protein product, partial [Prorocentrum cordatum]